MYHSAGDVQAGTQGAHEAETAGLMLASSHLGPSMSLLLLKMLLCLHLFAVKMGFESFSRECAASGPTTSGGTPLDQAHAMTCSTAGCTKAQSYGFLRILLDCLEHHLPGEVDSKS